VFHQEFIDELRTGVYSIDLFLKTTNPDNARRKSKVFSPDQPRARRYTPKSPVLPLNVDLDLSIILDTPATWTTGTMGIDLSNFFPDSGWAPKVTIRNYSQSKGVDLDLSDISVNPSDQTVSFSISYDKGLAALGMVDPGTWAFYATQTIDGVESLIELAAGNLQIKTYR
jgi:hypothetical protein